MLKVLKGSKSEINKRYFDEMYRLRYKVFVEGRGWSLPSKGGFEFDQYDVQEAVYFIDLDEDGNISGSVRITPTDRYSLLADYFPHLVSDVLPPRSERVYEATRYIALPKEKSAEANRKAKARIVAASLLWCKEHEIQSLQTVIDAELLATFLEMSEQVKVMGDTIAYGGGKAVPGGGECLAITVPVTDRVIDDVLRFGALDRCEFINPDLAA